MNERHYTKLILKKGGKLFIEYNEWDSDNDSPAITKKTEITDAVPVNWLHTFDCELEVGFTLGDFFLYLDKNLEYWDLLIGNFLKEYVEQSKLDPETKDADDVLTKIVLEWELKSDKYRNKKSVGMPNLIVSAIGTRSGVETNFSLGGESVANYKNLPIELKKGMTFYYENMDLNFAFRKFRDGEDFLKTLNHKNFIQKVCPKLWSLIFRFNYWLRNEKRYLGECNTSLFQIVFSILWELSFYGGPEEKKLFFDKLGDQVKSFKITQGELFEEDK